MAVNFSTDVYLPAQNLFSRPITVMPVASQPGAAAYSARGILDVDAIDVGAIDDSIMSEVRIVLDIREAEFAVLPIQGDVIAVPAESSGLSAEGSFVVLDADPNGGGETTLTLRRMVPAKP